MAQQQPIRQAQVPLPFMGPHDLDAWNISMYPRDLLQVFKPMSPVQLVSHAPTIKDHPTFKDWVSIGQSVFNIKIHPKFKQPLLQILFAADIVILGSDYPEALIRGNQVITCNVFIRCLEKASIDTVRVQGYGMKMGVRLPYDGPALGSISHPMSNLNTFDLAVNYPSSTLWLVTNHHDGIPGLQQYPILTPVGKGYGGIQMPVKYGGQAFQVKIYPRIVHQIKAQAGNHMLTKPKQVKACRSRRTTLLSHLTQMEKLSGRQLGGLRVEATITSPTLHLAVQNIAATPVLNLAQYLNPTIEAMQPYKVRSLKVPKDSFIANIRNLLAKAEEQEVFHGRDSNPAHPDSQQIIIDLFNALGWHTGRFEPTRWDHPAAWWLHSAGNAPVITNNDVQVEVEAGERRQPSKALLQQHLPSMDALRSFYDQVKQQLSCPRCNKAAPALFNQGGRRQFRLQCKGCKARFNQDQAREYFGQLLDQGHLDLSGLEAFPTEEAGNDEVVEEVTTEEEETDMPDLGSSSGSSGEDQAPIHPLHGPRRQSKRLRQPEPVDEPVNPSSVVVILPAAKSTVYTGVQIKEGVLQNILDQLDQDLGMSAPSPTHHRSMSRQPGATSVHSPTPVMPLSQPLRAKPMLHPVIGETWQHVVLRTLFNLKVSMLIKKDGNCLFRAMAHHLYGNQSLHIEVRRSAIEWLEHNPGLLKFAAQGEGHFSASAYLANMAKPGEWGDEIMLMAISQAYHASIMVFFGQDASTSGFNSTVYPHDAPGPHYGLMHISKMQHYELLYP